MGSKIRILGVAAVAAAALMQVTAAHAAVLDWSFTAFNGLSGGGTFTANQDGANPVVYHLTSVTGTIGGEAVTLSGYDSADNVAFPTSAVVIDTLGIGFATSGGLFYNLYEDFGNVGPAYACGSPYCIEGPNAFDQLALNVQSVPTLSITLEAVPEPATWTMMVVGVGVLGGALRQRRKLAMAAA